MSITNDWIRLHLPGWQHLGRYLLWGIGRVGFSAWLFSLHGIKQACKLGVYVVDMTERGSLKLLDVYDQLPHMGQLASAIEVKALPVTDEIGEVVTDIVGMIEGKQLMIIGEMGSGKSTIAQYLAYTVGGRVKVYECEGTPTDWQGLEVIGRGEDWDAIEQGMLADLDDLSSQIKTRLDKGDAALVGTERVIICEEYPELVSKVPSSGEWLERHARRGRKARRFTILLSQYDRVSAWGIEGKSDLGDAFYRLRLGKKAVQHAKSLKNEVLVDWLRSDRSHCLLDDMPCKLPNYREMKAVTQRLQIPASFTLPVTAEMTVQTAFQPVETPEIDLPDPVIRAVRACLTAGMAESRVIKEVLGYEGSRYQLGKALLQQLREERGN
jgi:energy-coupling factor transporter ATP-binding protein EcfA2